MFVCASSMSIAVLIVYSHMYMNLHKRPPLQGTRSRVPVIARASIASIATLAMLLAVFATTGAQAWASSASSPPPAPGLSPINPGPRGYFQYTIKPGASTSGAFTVRNLTTTPATYLIYVSDTTTSPVSGVAYDQPETHITGVPSWIKLSTGLVHLASGGTSTVHFSVTVPKGTASGDYVVGLVAQTQIPTTSPSTSAPLITTSRVIVDAVVVVPGPMKGGASFGQPSIPIQQHRRQVLVIPIHDTGNVLMQPYLAGKLLSCSSGKTVLNLDRQLDTFVPHTSINYPWDINHQIVPAGCYRASLTLTNNGIVLAHFNGTLHVAKATKKTHMALWVQILEAVGLIMAAIFFGFTVMQLSK